MRLVLNIIGLLLVIVIVLTVMMPRDATPPTERSDKTRAALDAMHAAYAARGGPVDAPRSAPPVARPAEPSAQSAPATPAPIVPRPGATASPHPEHVTPGADAAEARGGNERPEPAETDDASAPDPIAAPSSGERLIDGRFSVAGAGTRDDPFILPWPLMLSANETFQPHADMEELPDWCDELDGAWVEISGFLFLPIVEEETDDLLVMRYEWDGCCIGLPPSAFDSFEVTLAEPLPLQRNTFDYGSVIGRLKVDPWTRDGWVLGLYLLNEATLVRDAPEL